MSEYRKLTKEELEEMAGEALPERAAMSLINANVAAPINAAVALNVLSDNSASCARRGRCSDKTAWRRSTSSSGSPARSSRADPTGRTR